MVLRTEPKKQPNRSEKRRHGQHHRQDKRYQNTYWPYLPLAFIVAVGFLINSMWPTLQSAVLGYATDTSVSGLLVETNTARGAKGLGKLALNSQLNKAAQAKANDMASRNYWSHNTPGGDEPWVFIQNAGYTYDAAGENLAYGFEGSATTVAGWMGSTPHRLNLLNSAYQDVGFGIVNAANFQDGDPQTIVVAMYGSPKPVASTPVSQPAPASTQPTPIQKTVETQSTPVPEPKKETNTQPAPKQQADNTEDIQQDPSQGLQTQQVARVEMLSGENAAWTMLAITVIAGAAAAIFLLRHSLFWHRVLVKGERFVSHHHFLDLAAIAVATLAFILTRTAGFIY